MLPCCNPILIHQTQIPHCCCTYSQFSVTTTVISHLFQVFISCKPLGSSPCLWQFGWKMNLRGGLSDHLLFLVLQSYSNTTLLTAVMTVGPNLLRQKTRPSITIICKSHLAKDLWSAHFRGDLKKHPRLNKECLVIHENEMAFTEDLRLKILGQKCHVAMPMWKGLVRDW